MALRRDTGCTDACSHAPAIGKRIEAGVRTGLTWAMRVLIGLGIALALLVFFTVRACNSEAPDLGGRWTSAEGWTIDFVAQAREGQPGYRVTGQAGAAGRLECSATPGFFGSVDLDCRVGAGSPAADTFTCTGLYVSSAPLSVSGDCKWQRDGSTRKLSLKR